MSKIIVKLSAICEDAQSQELPYTEHHCRGKFTKDAKQINGMNLKKEWVQCSCMCHHPELYNRK